MMMTKCILTGPLVKLGSLASLAFSFLESLKTFSVVENILNKIKKLYKRKLKLRQMPFFKILNSKNTFEPDWAIFISSKTFKIHVDFKAIRIYYKINIMINEEYVCDKISFKICGSVKFFGANWSNEMLYFSAGCRTADNAPPTIYFHF